MKQKGSLSCVLKNEPGRKKSVNRQREWHVRRAQWWGLEKLLGCGGHMTGGEAEGVMLAVLYKAVSLEFILGSCAASSFVFRITHPHPYLLKF